MCVLNVFTHCLRLYELFVMLDFPHILCRLATLSYVFSCRLIHILYMLMERSSVYALYIVSPHAAIGVHSKHHAMK